MNKNAKELCEKLNIKYNPEAEPFFESGMKLYKEKGLFPFDKERLISYNNKYNIFRKWFDDILAAADEVAKDEDLVEFVYTLIAAMKADRADVITAPDRGRLDTDYAPMYAILYFLEDMIGDMEKRGVPHDVISDTLNGLDTEINDYYDMYGRGGMRIYVFWFMLFIRGELLRVGRLQFQIKKFADKIKVFKKDGDVKILIDGSDVHQKGMLFGSAKQDDEAGKYFAGITYDGESVTGHTVNKYGECQTEKITLCGYDEALKAGDYVINVHIPSHAPFTTESCEDAYSRALDIFKKCYSEYDFKAFMCSSWMMEKKLRDIMERDTNITRFADKYITYPLHSLGNGVYSFLFHVPKVCDPSELPENSSMQRAVKKYLEDGNIFYEKGGIILM